MVGTRFQLIFAFNANQQPNELYDLIYQFESDCKYSSIESQTCYFQPLKLS